MALRRQRPPPEVIEILALAQRFQISLLGSIGALCSKCKIQRPYNTVRQMDFALVIQ